MKSIHAQLEQRLADRSIISLFTLVREQQATERPPSKASLADLPATLLDRLTAKQGRIARFIVLTGDPLASDAAKSAFDRMEQSITALQPLRITGLPLLVRHETVSLIGQLHVGLFIAILVSVLTVAIAYRNPLLAGVLILPNVVPLLLVGSAVHLLNAGHLNPPAILALTVSVGIAIDDSIHFLNRFRIELAAGRTHKVALANAMQHVGGVLISTSLLISAVLLVTLLSSFATIKLFGLLLILTLFVALLADLVLLPAILRALRFGAPGNR